MPKKQLYKLIGFLILIVTLFILKQFTPLGEKMTIEFMQSVFEPLGPWGIAIYLAVFCVGIILQLPGILFIAASIPIFGNLTGTLVAYSGSVLAVVASFYFARVIGGNALAHIKNQRVQNILGKVERNPVKTIIVLRSFMWVSPPLNYALAFSTVSSRTYIIGSALGLLGPVLVISIGYNCFF